MTPGRWLRLARAAAITSASLLVAGACSAGGTADDGGGPGAEAAIVAPDGDSGTDGGPAADEATERTGDDGTGAEQEADDDATGSAGPGLPSAAPPAPIEWIPCEGGLFCGEVIVPVDHAEPGGETMAIALLRVPAREERRGSIFVNPGGPGASGIDFVLGGFRFDPDTMDVFDLIGFDPRGVGRSDALACAQDRTAGPLPDFSPDDDAERRLLDDAARTLAESCAAADRNLLDHLDTESVARDLDLARAAVGDEHLHFYGFSFGTLIGQVYADLFPERIGHLVLDGVVDPTASLTELLTQQAAAFEASFAKLDDECGRTLTCPDDGITTAFDRVLAELEQVGSVGEVGPAEFEYAAIVTLYSERLKGPYAAALIAADAGDYTAIEALSDRFIAGIDFAAYAAVECTDSPSPRGADAWDAFAAELAALAPRFGATIANELRACAFWPVDVQPSRPALTAAGAAPALVVGTSNDPATPLVNAEQVARTLGSATLIVLDSDRHTAYQASSCVQEVVRAYFVDDVVPSSDVRCDA